jgi:uncharacterized protein YjbJ (UPF0337 family)
MEAFMNWEHVEGSWMQFKGKVREKWAKLTDDDLELIAGKRDRLLGKLKEKYGDQKENMENQVDHFIENLDSKTPRH